jgi:hypothetical protein
MIRHYKHVLEDASTLAGIRVVLVSIQTNIPALVCCSLLDVYLAKGSGPFDGATTVCTGFTCGSFPVFVRLSVAETTPGMQTVCAAALWKVLEGLVLRAAAARL